MKKALLILFLTLALIFAGCTNEAVEEDDEEEPTYTISLTVTNGAAYNGVDFCVAVYKDGDTYGVDTAVMTGSATITANTATVSGSVVAGEYDVYAMIDLDGNDIPNAGDQVWNSDLTVNGDESNSIDAMTDMSAY